MKLLLLISLIGLISCGGDKGKPVEDTKKVVETKAYGTHTLTIYDDGSKEWAYGAEYTPIADLDAHKAKADTIVSRMRTSYPGGRKKWEVFKYETLKGGNWFVVKSTATFSNGDPEEVSYHAYNTKFFTDIGAVEVNIPLNDGEVELSSVYNLNVDEHGVFVGTEGPDAVGYYNKLGDFGDTGKFRGIYDDSSTVIPTTSIYAYDTPFDLYGPQSVPAYDLEDIGADLKVDRDYFNFEESSSVEKDMEKIGAEMEAMEVAEMEEILINYGLSNERSEKLGKLMNFYRKIKTKRALNAKEKDIFTKELTGLSFDKAADQMVEDYDGLIDRAAELNETSPEAIKELINTIM